MVTDPDKETEYLDLCEKYGEKPRYYVDRRNVPILDVSGQHHRALKKRAIEEEKREPRRPSQDKTS